MVVSGYDRTLVYTSPSLHSTRFGLSDQLALFVNSLFHLSLFFLFFVRLSSICSARMFDLSGALWGTLYTLVSTCGSCLVCDTILHRSVDAVRLRLWRQFPQHLTTYSSTSLGAEFV